MSSVVSISENSDNQPNDAEELKQETENDDDVYTTNAETSDNKKDVIRVPIKTVGNHDEKFTICALYSKEEKMKHLFAAIKKKVSAYSQLVVTISYIYSSSFTGEVDEPEEDDFANKSITDYDRQAVIEKGLEVWVNFIYEHKIDTEIECPYLLQGKACPIYDGVKEKSAFTEKNLRHLIEFAHFKNEFVEKPECKEDDDECPAFKRMEVGGNRLDDRCHMKVYRHPPRGRNMKLADNVEAFIVKEDQSEVNEPYEPTDADEAKYACNDKDRYLSALIDEVIRNGFKSDLCLFCGPNDDCPHNEYSILQVVEEKMEHVRHKKVGSPLSRDRMLALILYTGCECNFDLCKSQRSGDYDKWKWFDYCLYWAILRLSQREQGSFSVYSGLHGVNMDKTSVNEGYFVTYVSASWNKQVAMEFKGDDKGMIIQFDESFKDNKRIYCCDVSWISKFTDECEVLFARSDDDDRAFQCEVIDEANGVQTALLKNKDEDEESISYSD